MHRRGWSTKKIDRHNVTTILSISTDGPFDGFWTGDRDPNATVFIQILQGDRKMDLEGNTVKIMVPYDPTEPLARLSE